MESAIVDDVIVLRARLTDRLGLTDREVEVLHAVGEGDTAAAIGWNLHMSLGTVHKHLENIYRKLGVHDKVTAVTIARDHGMIR